MYSSGASKTEIEKHAEEIEIDYLLEDLPKMINSIQLGCDHIINISTSLRIFSRADTKPIVKGTGLGLAIARQIIVEKHEGTLNVNSTIGQGSEFELKIPIGKFTMTFLDHS